MHLIDTCKSSFGFGRNFLHIYIHSEPPNKCQKNVFEFEPHQSLFELKSTLNTRQKQFCLLKTAEEHEPTPEGDLDSCMLRFQQESVRQFLRKSPPLNKWGGVWGGWVGPGRTVT